MTALPDPLSTERLHDPLLPTQSMAPFELPNHGVRVVRDEKSHCVLGFLCFHVHEMSFIAGSKRSASRNLGEVVEINKNITP